MKHSDGMLVKMMKMIYECSFGVDLNMNDTFNYGSDSEETDLRDWAELAELFEKYGIPGVNAWTAVKRGYDVIEKRQNEKYWAAKNEILKKININTLRICHKIPRIMCSLFSIINGGVMLMITHPMAFAEEMAKVRFS